MEDLLSMTPILSNPDSSEFLFDYIRESLSFDTDVSKKAEKLPTKYWGLLQLPVFRYGRQFIIVGNNEEIISKLFRAVANVANSISRIPQIDKETFTDYLYVKSKKTLYKDRNLLIDANGIYKENAFAIPRLMFRSLNTSFTLRYEDGVFDLREINLSGRVVSDPETYIQTTLTEVATSEKDILEAPLRILYGKNGHATFFVFYPQLKAFTYFNPHHAVSGIERHDLDAFLKSVIPQDHPFQSFTMMHEENVIGNSDAASLQEIFDTRCLRDGNCVALSQLVKYVCARLGFWFPSIISIVLTNLVLLKVIDPEKVLYGLRGLLFLDLYEEEEMKETFTLPFSPDVFLPQTIQSLTSPVKKLALGGRKRRSNLHKKRSKKSNRSNGSKRSKTTRIRVRRH